MHELAMFKGTVPKHARPCASQPGLFPAIGWLLACTGKA